MSEEQKSLLNISRRLLLDTALTEKQIAKILFISESNFRGLYNKYLGMPPRTYIKLVKMKKAQTWLRISDRSITEIAFLIGYTNTSKFSYAFKKIYGVTPSKYRKMLFWSRN